MSSSPPLTSPARSTRSRTRAAQAVEGDESPIPSHPVKVEPPRPKNGSNGKKSSSSSSSDDSSAPPLLVILALLAVCGGVAYMRFVIQPQAQQAAAGAAAAPKRSTLEDAATAQPAAPLEPAPALSPEEIAVFEQAAEEHYTVHHAPGASPHPTDGDAPGLTPEDLAASTAHPAADAHTHAVYDAEEERLAAEEEDMAAEQFVTDSFMAEDPPSEEGSGAAAAVAEEHDVIAEAVVAGTAHPGPAGHGAEQAPLPAEEGEGAHLAEADLHIVEASAEEAAEHDAYHAEVFGDLAAEAEAEAEAEGHVEGGDASQAAATAAQTGEEAAAATAATFDPAVHQQYLDLLPWPQTTEAELMGSWNLTQDIYDYGATLPAAKVLSWENPRVVLFPSFLSPEEVGHMITISKNNLQRSEVLVAEGEEALSDIRTSMGFWPETDDVTSRITERIHRTIGIPEPFGEGMYVLNYVNGQKYEAHNDHCIDGYSGNVADAACQDFLKRSGGPGCGPGQGGPTCGDRVATFILYLKSPTKGGQTAFPEADITKEAMGAEHRSGNSPDEWYCEDDRVLATAPAAGTGVLFWDYAPGNGAGTGSYLDGSAQPTSQTVYAAMHAGCPVLEGEKYIATRWIRSAGFDTPRYHTGPYATDAGVEADVDGNVEFGAAATTDVDIDAAAADAAEAAVEVTGATAADGGDADADGGDGAAAYEAAAAAE